MNNNLKIIKARVEQDKYATVEMKIIKNDGVKILKDLYVEKELNDGEFYVASDNVLVALHRTLRNGEVANLQLVANSGDVLIEPLYSRISQVNDNIFICVKSVSEMESVVNNQNSKSDALKVQEIALDAKNIKNQITNTMKNSNPNGSLRFVFEDAYKEAVIYRIDKNNDGYDVKVIGDNVSFVAVDNVNIYSHSNVVSDITKVESIDVVPSVQSVAVDVNSVNNTVEVQGSEVPSEVEAPVVPEPVSTVPSYTATKPNAILDNPQDEVQNNVAPQETPNNVLFNDVASDTPLPEVAPTPVAEVPEFTASPVNAEINDVGVEVPEVPEVEASSVPNNEEVSNDKQEEVKFDNNDVDSGDNSMTNEIPEEVQTPVNEDVNNVELNEVTSDDISMPADIAQVDTNIINNLADNNDNQVETESEDATATINNFFGIDSDVNNEDVSSTQEEVNTNDIEEPQTNYSFDAESDEEYDQLSTVISKLISREKKSREKIANYEEQISKLQGEVENKTKKVNALINENRKFIDENRALKNRVSGLEAKTTRLEEANNKYMLENRKLKEEANRRKTKINDVISSIDEVLGSYK